MKLDSYEVRKVTKADLSKKSPDGSKGLKNGEKWGFWGFEKNLLSGGGQTHQGIPKVCNMMSQLNFKN